MTQLPGLVDVSQLPVGSESEGVWLWVWLTCKASTEGGVGNGKLATWSIPRAFICNTRSSTGLRQMSGSENWINWFWNTADEYSLGTSHDHIATYIKKPYL